MLGDVYMKKIKKKKWKYRNDFDEEDEEEHVEW